MTSSSAFSTDSASLSALGAAPGQLLEGSSPLAKALPAALDSRRGSVGVGVDIVWRHYRSGQVLGWFLDQLQVQQSQLLGDVVADLNWHIEGTGDFNNDGQEDILWRHQSIGQVVVWYMNNGQLQQGALVGQVVSDTQWKIQGVGDFNRDGNDDILWRHYASGQVVAWHMDGAGNLQNGALLGDVVPDLNWRIEGVGDFNGDGLDDVLWRHYASGQNVAWHLNAQGRIASSALVGQVVSDLNWQIEGVGDLNGDGETDILLRHYGSGQNLGWLMNDNQVIGAQLIGPNVPDPEWRPLLSRRSLVAPPPIAAPIEQAKPKPTPPASSPPAQPPVTPPPSFDIEIDYRFDSQGWFTPERRASLEAAVQVWEAIIQDEFADVPTGTQTPFVRHPETGEYVSTGGDNIYLTTSPIDDLRIFVGARNLGANSLGQGGASGFYTNESRYVGDDFEPWLGSITFNSVANWFFDDSPETIEAGIRGKSDFLSTALHEIGHVLGFSASIRAFANQLDGANNFAGANARAANGGNAIPLTGSHIRDGYEFNGSGETLLDPVSFAGMRQLPTRLDISILDDIGYEVNYNQARTNASERRSSGVTGDTGLGRTLALGETAGPGQGEGTGEGAIADHDGLAPSCCRCNSCHNAAPQAMAWVGETDLAQLIVA